MYKLVNFILPNLDFGSNPIMAIFFLCPLLPTITFYIQHYYILKKDNSTAHRNINYQDNDTNLSVFT